MNPFRWIGAQQDTKAAGGAGHYKLGARYYSTAGRFTQPDPVAGGLSDPRTLTGYNYAGGDPINQSDPSGNYFGESVVNDVKGYFSSRFQSVGQVLGECAGGATVGVVSLAAGTGLANVAAVAATGGTALVPGAFGYGAAAVTGCVGKVLS